MSSIVRGSSGHLYALVTGSHSLIKVGCTTLDPHERARQLSAATASPTPFFVAYSRWHNDVNIAEASAHELLDEYRVNDGREFFSCSLYQAVSVIDRVCVAFEGRNSSTPMSELFSTFPDDGSPRNLTEDEREQCRALQRTLK